MKIETFESGRERSALTQMILSTEVLGKLIPYFPKDLTYYEEGPFSSPWANLVAIWCVEYFRKYLKAPGKVIEDLFTDWAVSCNDKDTLSLVEAFLQGLAGYPEEDEDSNPEHEVEMARKYFEQVKITKLQENLSEDVEAGNFKRGKERIISFKNPPDGLERLVDVFQDHEAIRSALEFSREPPLIDYGDSGLGMFFGDCFKKGEFIALQAPDKNFKSMWILDMAFRAVANRKRVLYFEAGDLTKDQLVLRFLNRVCKRPFLREGETELLQIPTGILRTKEGVDLICEGREFTDPLDVKTAIKACHRFMRERVKSDESYIKVHCSSNDTLTVETINSTITSLEMDGWCPDVVVIDYADIMAMPKGHKESRDQINQIWQGLRRISQEGKLVITVTQSDAKAYTRGFMGKDNFSNDKRKYSHVTGMIGLISYPDEREQGISRLNWLVRRGRSFNEKRVCFAAGAMALANPSMVSIF